LAKSRPSERSKISLLEDNSLEIGTGKLIRAEQGIYRAEQGICSVSQGIAHHGIDSAAIEVKL